MSLSCGCDMDWYPEPGDTYILDVSHYQEIPFFTLRKRCCSCKKLINTGSTVLRIYRVRCPKEGIEERIYGEGGEIPVASIYMCENCSDIYLSLEEIGYCPQVTTNQYKLLEEHNESNRNRNTDSKR